VMSLGPASSRFWRWLAPARKNSLKPLHGDSFKTQVGNYEEPLLPDETYPLQSNSVADM
jgi:hypothetical protein